MMQWLHRISTSWVASLLMGVLALSFVVWGIADVFTGMRSTALATVGSTEISSDAFQRFYKTFVRNQGQQMGMEITPELAQQMGLGNVALQQLISRTALDNSARRLGLITDDATLAEGIRNEPAFRGPTGKFEKNSFLQLIQSVGYTENTFLAEMRANMTRDQLASQLGSGFALPQSYVQAIYAYVSERRAAEYVIVSPEAAGAVPPPSEAQLAAYVKAHPDRFSTPEYREIEFARIGPQDVAEQASVTEAMIAQDYAAHKSLYEVAEKRDVQQIEFAKEADAKAARAQIESGKTFDALAAEKKIKPADLSLGVLSKADLADPVRGEAAFSLPLNQVSQPVKTALGGYVLLRVTAITPGVSRSLDDVREQIRAALSLQVAAGKLTDIINAYEDASSGGEELTAAAKKAGMKTAKLAAIDKNGLAPDGTKPADLPPDPEFLAQAFATESGESGDPFAAKSGENYVLKVNGVTPPKLKSLDQVRAEAVTAWTDEQRQTALSKKAFELAARANSQSSLAQVAKELKVPVQQSPGLTRGTSDTTFSTALVQKIFTAAPGGVVEAAQGVGANHIIARVTGIAHPPATGIVYDGGRAQLSQQAASDIVVSFTNAARLREGVKVNQQMLQSALGQQ